MKTVRLASETFIDFRSGWPTLEKYTSALAESALILHFSLSYPPHSTGMFGTGILSYFSFLRFLVMLNLIIFVLMFSFVMLPIIIVPHASGNITYNPNYGEGSLVCFNPLCIK